MNWGWLQIGDGWFRLFGRGLTIDGPSVPPSFTERYGYRDPIVKFRGWRVFWLGADTWNR